jgi:hypothetical protein
MNKLQPNSMCHKLSENTNGDDISKLQSTTKKMIFLNMIHQEHKKNMVIIDQKDKLKKVLEEVLDRFPVDKNSESELTDIPNSETEIMDLDFTNIYDKNESEIVYEKNEHKLKTITNILYSKHKLDQLIKNKKW